MARRSKPVYLYAPEHTDVKVFFEFRMHGGKAGSYQTLGTRSSWEG